LVSTENMNCESENESGIESDNETINNDKINGEFYCDSCGSSECYNYDPNWKRNNGEEYEDYYDYRFIWIPYYYTTRHSRRHPLFKYGYGLPNLNKIRNLYGLNAEKIEETDDMEDLQLIIS
ncbi:4062_t:CDS:2, partial [Dentiscutata heterogama]